MEPIAAGSFAAWVRDMQRALRGEMASDVPCDGCKACCESAMFIPVGPDEHDALAHIPAELLFAAPQRPGYQLLPHDDRGRCPMLAEHGCSIHAHRPRACRVYDCRAFAAAGIELDEPSLAPVAARVARWRFDEPTADDTMHRDALLAAVAFLTDDIGPLYEVAGLAAEVHELFMGGDADTALVRAAVAEIRGSGGAASGPAPSGAPTPSGRNARRPARSRAPRR
jgi:hypothetical protein